MTESTQTVLQLQLARAHVVRRLDVALGDHHGLALSDFAILAALNDSPDGRCRRGELAERLGLSPSTVTRQLAPLERMGLVGREPHARDARLALATLTDTGRRVLGEAEVTAAEASERALARLSGEDREALGALLGLLRAA